MSKMTEDIVGKEKYRELIAVVFEVDGISDRGKLNNYINNLSIYIFPEYRKVVCTLKFKLNGVYIEASGIAKCNPEDFWNEYTGVLLALTRLRINLSAKIADKLTCKQNKKRWVPNIGERYYAAYFDEEGKSKVEVCVWSDSEYDFTQLAEDNVFRTEREAMKNAKRHMFEGRKIAKESRRGRKN